MFDGVKRPIFSSNAQVVTSAGGVIGIETTGEQLDESICRSASDGWASTPKSARTPSRQMLTEQAPGQGLSKCFYSSAGTQVAGLPTPIFLYAPPFCKRYPARVTKSAVMIAGAVGQTSFALHAVL